MNITKNKSLHNNQKFLINVGTKNNDWALQNALTNYIIRNNKKPPIFFLFASLSDIIPHEVLKKIVDTVQKIEIVFINLYFIGNFRFTFIKV